MVETPVTIVGFEKEFLERLRKTVQSLPAGTADLYIGHYPSSPKSFPWFRIMPTNPRAAKIEGFVIDGQGIDFMFGDASTGEVFVSPKRTSRQLAHVERFFRLCQAIFTEHAVELVVRNIKGRPIWTRLTIPVDGRTEKVGGGYFLWWLSPKRTKRVIRYEPYY